jgi:hypothetical protein
MRRQEEEVPQKRPIDIEKLKSLRKERYIKHQSNKKSPKEPSTYIID